MPNLATDYERRGIADRFPWRDPPLGRLAAAVTERRLRGGVTHAIRQPIDARFPQAERVVPVLDSFKT